MSDLKGMSIDIEGLMAEVEKFRNRLAQLEDELTLGHEKRPVETAEQATVQQVRREAARARNKRMPAAKSDRSVSQDSQPAAVDPQPESDLAELVRSAFAHRRSRRS